MKSVSFHSKRFVRYASNKTLNKSNELGSSLARSNILNEVQNELASKNKNKDVASSTNTNISENTGEASSAKYRYNEYGIQMISECLRQQLFCNKSKNVDENLHTKCLKALHQFKLGEKREFFKVTDFELPKLLGSNVEEHFYKIGLMQSEPYKLLIGSLINKIPKPPKNWVCRAGWTQYKNGTAKSIPFPPDDALLFDVEVCKSEGEMPTIATAASTDAWYGWVSQHLADGVKQFNNNNYTTLSLIPLESHSDCKTHGKRQFNRPRIVVGHGVSFDRARVKEQYWLQKSHLRFLDTLSLHVCVSGITSYQKSLLKAGVEGENEWSKLSSLNNLSKVHKLYCGSEISKEERELFIEGSITDIRNNFQKMMQYCAVDVESTHRVLSKLWPMFLDRFPHPVTLAGMLELQMAYVPVSRKWSKYISDSRATYEDLSMEAKYLLSQTAKNTCKLFHQEKYKQDLWMWDQDWTIKRIKVKKNSASKNSLTHEPSATAVSPSDDIVTTKLNELTYKFNLLLNTKDKLPARKTILPGYPEWYRKLCTKSNEKYWVPGPTLLTNSMQVAPKLLKLTWKDLPLHYVRGSGWGYISPSKSTTTFDDLKFPIDTFQKFLKENNCVPELKLPEDIDENNVISGVDLGNEYSFIKLPHKGGAAFNVGNPLAQDYINKFSDNGFSGSLSNAQRIISISKMLSYWRNNRDRIESQLVCWLTQREISQFDLDDSAFCFGAILPSLIVSGTLTRRAVEPTWMTVSNSVVDRIGSEFRGVLEAPPDYCFVGADVDSQELWIASLLGDAYSAGLHGCTPFGWMTLNGHRSDGSDLHSVTAKAVGISRTHAKILNYARIYGSGQKFAERTLLNFNPDMTPSEATTKASKMYQLTKGRRMFILKDGILPQIKQRSHTRFQAAQICKMFGKEIDEIFKEPQWIGGTESEMFNSLECIANQTDPETPFLKSKLSRALIPDVDSEDKHGNTRINWVVQSSAVDFLHLMLVCMKWLLGDDAKFSLSFHDEVHYLVPTKDKYKVALALQITNLLTRTFCVSRVGMTDLPLSVAFFSSVEIDSVLRKDPLDDNKTPSNPHGLFKGYGIPPGESLDIHECIKMASKSNNL